MFCMRIPHCAVGIQHNLLLPRHARLSLGRILSKYLNSLKRRAGLIRVLGSSACIAIALATPMDEAAAQDPVGGAIVGGATGAIIGGVLGGGRGAAIGAIIGGATGAAIGAEGELRPGGYRYYQDACYQQQPDGAWLAVSPEYCAPAPAYAQDDAGIAVDVAPPPLPVYDQPPIPAPGYIWTPGYWAWNDDTGYYWVPGTWVLPPEPALLWTPGYWGWNDGVYAFHQGYWGPEVGYYGGVSYGHGYTGDGYEGGYWRGGAFFYNRTVNNISNVQINNVYNKTVVVNNVTNVSYNGGAGVQQRRPHHGKLPPPVSSTCRRHRNKRSTYKRPRKIRRCRSTTIKVIPPLRRPRTRRN